MDHRLHIYRSNRVENLADALADILGGPAGGPLDREVVVFHSPGLERLIEMQVAQRLGICANVEFLYPGDLIGRLLAAATGDGEDAAAWTAARQEWEVLACLPVLLASPSFANISSYLDAGENLNRSRRTCELAHPIAVHFERYAAYRPLLVQR